MRGGSPTSGSPPVAVGDGAAAGAAAPARRARLMLVLRTLVSAALLAVLVTRIDLAHALPRQRHLSTLGWFAAALAAATVGIGLSAWRWQRVLAVFGVRAPLGTLWGHYLAGQFVGNVLPSTIGGDVVRVSRAAGGTTNPETAFASVALERLTGFVALPLLTAVGFAFGPDLLGVPHAWAAVMIASTTLGILAGILFLTGHPRLAGRFRNQPGWVRFLGAVHEGVDAMRRDPRGALGVLGTACVYQISTVATVWFVIRTLELSLPVAAVIAFVPAVAMAQVLPISVSGLGVREGMLVLLFGPLGVSAGQAVAVGLLWYCVMLLVSVPGAPALAVGHRVRHRATRATGVPAAPGPVGPTRR